jgi:hypothetical protein
LEGGSRIQHHFEWRGEHKGRVVPVWARGCGRLGGHEGVEGTATIESELGIVYQKQHFRGGFGRVPDESKTGDILDY